jgi:DNA polymerase III sliding clamp (beta) subunit (PCNA family)
MKSYVEIESKPFESELTLIKKVVSSTEFLTITADGKDVWLFAQSGASRIMLRSAAKCKGKLEFTANLLSLSGFIKGRKILRVGLDGDSGRFEAPGTSYRGQFSLSSFDFEKPIEDSVKKSGEAITTTVRQALIDHLSAVAISPQYDDYNIPFIVNVKNDVMQVMGVDRHHLAVSEVKLEKAAKKPVTILLPMKLAEVVQSAAKNFKGLKFAVEGNILYFWSDSIEACMPMVEYGFQASPKEVMELFKTGKHVATFKAEDLKRITENLLAVEEEGVTVKVKLGKSALTIGIDSKFGSVSEELEATIIKGGAGKTAKLNPRTLMDVINLAGGEIDMLFDGDKSVTRIVFVSKNKKTEATKKYLVAGYG